MPPACFGKTGCLSIQTRAAAGVARPHRPQVLRHGRGTGLAVAEIVSSSFAAHPFPPQVPRHKCDLLRQARVPSQGQLAEASNVELPLC